MEKRPLVIVKNKTIEVFVPDGFNLVVNGEAIIGEASTNADQQNFSTPPDIMSGLPPSNTPEVIILPQTRESPKNLPEAQAAIQQSSQPKSATLDTSQNFFDLFEKLRLQVPRIGLQCVNNENSPYCQYTEESKNCYMTFASYESEDCLYNTRVFYCRDCIDCTLCYKCELCYECIDCINCYNCSYSTLCEQAIDCDFCFFCIGTQNCFGCVGLTKKSFYIFNQAFAKEEYSNKIAELKRLPLQQILQNIEPLLRRIPRSAFYGRNNEESCGENIFNCKKVFWGFDSKNVFEGAYIYHCDDSKDLVDCSHLGWSELCYEIMSGGKLTNCNFCFGCWNSYNLGYCELVYNSHDCFGCIGLNHAEYCIFNIKYPQEEYFKKVAEIKEQMKRAGEYGKWFTSTYKEVLTAGL